MGKTEVGQEPGPQSQPPQQIGRGGRGSMGYRGRRGLVGVYMEWKGLNNPFSGTFRPRVVSLRPLGSI